MLGCTPYAEEEINVEMNDTQEYQDWLAEYKENDNETDN